MYNLTEGLIMYKPFRLTGKKNYVYDVKETKIHFTTSGWISSLISFLIKDRSICTLL